MISTMCAMAHLPGGGCSVRQIVHTGLSGTHHIIYRALFQAVFRRLSPWDAHPSIQIEEIAQERLTEGKKYGMITFALDRRSDVERCPSG